MAQAAGIRHQLDGGRSRAVQTSLEPLLDEVRRHLHADVALAVYESFSRERDICVLASSATEGVQLPLPNEPLSLSHGHTTKHPTALQDVVLTSTVRKYRLELAAALLVPWRDASGRGWLIAGLRPHSWNRGVLDLALASDFIPRLQLTHEMAGLAGTVRLQGDVAQAVRFLAEACLENRDVSSILEAVVFAARSLLGTSVAYASLPDDDPDYFLFSTLLDIRTSEFRRLRVRKGEGLGGFTREQLKTIRSLNYAEDSRLRHAPVAETLREGILSAMCTPLMADGRVIGLLYVGNRHITPFTQTDAAIIEEFAGYATLGIRHAQAEEHRRTVMRRREQEQLAGRLHDSVVRSLMQIGFQAEEGMVVPGDPTLRHRFAIIGQAAEFCLETLREQLTELTGGPSTQVTIGEAAETIRSARWRDSMDLFIDIDNATWSNPLPGETAQALIRIAQEAIDNAQLHADCSRCRIEIAHAEDALHVRISDNGRGMDPDTIVRLLCEDSRHLGLRGMRGAAREVGGHLSIAPGAEGGLAIEAFLPLRPLADGNRH